MTAWRRAIELSIEEEDLGRLMSIARSRTEAASRVERTREAMWVVHLMLTLAALYGVIITGMFLAQTWLLFPTIFAGAPAACR